MNRPDELITATSSTTCRGCGVQIESGEQIAWGLHGPYHPTCSPTYVLDSNIKSPAEAAAINSTAIVREKHGAVAGIICIAMLLWALVPANPYGYYVLLRWVVCGISLYVAVKAYQQKKMSWTWIFCGVAVLFNPLIPIYLTRNVWSVVDLATAIVFATRIWRT
jgi:hypothetical protein